MGAFYIAAIYLTIIENSGPLFVPLYILLALKILALQLSR
jgi:hypothetical protein